MKLRATLLLIAVAGLFFACPNPSPPNGALTCGTGGSCPHGYECGPGNKCFSTGAHLDLSAALDQGGVDQASPRDFTTGDGLSKSTMCEQLCQCLKTTCNGIGAAPGADDDTAACGTTCLANVAQDLQCRWEHCTVFAPSDPQFHCPHARGQDPLTCL